MILNATQPDYTWMKFKVLATMKKEIRIGMYIGTSRQAAHNHYSKATTRSKR